MKRPFEVIRAERGLQASCGPDAAVAAEDAGGGAWVYTVKCRIHFSSPGVRFQVTGANPGAALALWKPHFDALHT